MKPKQTTADLVDFIREYNLWRSGDYTLEMQHPKQIGEALDGICERVEELEKQRDELAQILSDTIDGYDVVLEIAPICSDYVRTTIEPAIAFLKEPTK